MDGNTQYTIIRNITIASQIGEFDTIECLFRDYSNIRICHYFEMACDNLYYYNFYSSYLLSEIIKCAEKYNCKINIHRIYGMNFKDYSHWVVWTYEKNKECLKYFVYLMKHNYDYIYFMDKKDKDYKTDELIIKKHVITTRNIFIFNNIKYNVNIKQLVNLYDICYMIIIV